MSSTSLRSPSLTSGIVGSSASGVGTVEPDPVPSAEPIAQ
jgi:hypothetical protein